MCKPEELKDGDRIILDGKERTLILPPLAKKFMDGQYMVPLMLDGGPPPTYIHEHEDVKKL